MVDQVKPSSFVKSYEFINPKLGKYLPRDISYSKVLKRTEQFEKDLMKRLVPNQVKSKKKPKGGKIAKNPPLKPVDSMKKISAKDTVSKPLVKSATERHKDAIKNVRGNCAKEEESSLDKTISYFAESYQKLDNAAREFYSTFGLTNSKVSSYVSDKNKIHDGFVKRPNFKSLDLKNCRINTSEFSTFLRIFTEYSYKAFGEVIEKNPNSWVYAKLTTHFTTKGSMESAYEQVTKALCKLDDKIAKNFYVMSSATKSITIHRVIHRRPEKLLIEGNLRSQLSEILSIHKIGLVKTFEKKSKYKKYPWNQDPSFSDPFLSEKHRELLNDFNFKYRKDLCKHSSRTQQCLSELNTLVMQYGWHKGKEYFYENCDKWIYLSATFAFKSAEDVVIADAIFRKQLNYGSSFALFRWSCTEVSVKEKKLTIFFFLEEKNDGESYKPSA